MTTHVSVPILKFSGVGLGPRQFRVRASETRLDSMGDIIVAHGITKRRGRVPAFINHGPNDLFGAADFELVGDAIDATMTALDEGIDPVVDKWLYAIKNGFVDAVSVGVNPLESAPIKGGGRKYTKFELLEISVVGIPALNSARVTAKSYEETQRAARIASAERLVRMGKAQSLALRLMEEEEERQAAVAETAPFVPTTLEERVAKAAALAGDEPRLARNFEEYAARRAAYGAELSMIRIINRTDESMRERAARAARIVREANPYPYGG